MSEATVLPACTACVYCQVHGGEPLASDLDLLRAQCPDVLIATPGRLMDILTQVLQGPCTAGRGTAGWEQLVGWPKLAREACHVKGLPYWG